MADMIVSRCKALLNHSFYYAAIYAAHIAAKYKSPLWTAIGVCAVCLPLGFSCKGSQSVVSVMLVVAAQVIFQVSRSCMF